MADIIPTPDAATPATADAYTAALIAALAEWRAVDLERVESDDPRYQLAAFAFDGGLGKARHCIDNADRAVIAALYAYDVLENIRSFASHSDQQDFRVVSETLLGLYRWAERHGTGAARPYVEYAVPAQDRG